MFKLMYMIGEFVNMNEVWNLCVLCGGSHQYTIDNRVFDCSCDRGNKDVPICRKIETIWILADGTVEYHDKHHLLSNIPSSGGTEWVYKPRYEEGEEVMGWVDHPVGDCPICWDGRHIIRRNGEDPIMINCPLCTNGRLMQPKLVMGTVWFRNASIRRNETSELYDFRWECGNRLLKITTTNEFRFERELER